MDKIVRKYITASVTKKAIDAEQGVYEVTITTDDLDRQGEIVMPTGMKADKYMTNPVVMWAHDYTKPPIGKAISLKVTPNSVISQFQFDPRGVYDEADRIHDLWDAGYINTVSIGFIALDMDASAAVPTITSWELLEYSLVPVPANANALRRDLDLVTMAANKLDPLTVHVDVQVKEGRVLSAHNLELVKNAIDALTALVEAAEPPDKAMTSTGVDEAPHTEPVTVPDPWAAVFH